MKCPEINVHSLADQNYFEIVATREIQDEAQDSDKPKWVVNIFLFFPFFFFFFSKLVPNFPDKNANSMSPGMFLILCLFLKIGY